MWRFALPGTLVVAALLAIMSLSFRPGNPPIEGWFGQRPVAPAPPPPAAPPARESFPTPVPQAKPARLSPAPNPLPAAGPPSKALSPQRLALAPPALAREPAPVVTVLPPPPPPPFQPPVPREPLAAPPPPRAVASNPPPARPETAEVRLRSARQALMQGDGAEARLDLERAETLLAFRPGRLDPSLTAGITDALSALAQGNRARALRRMDDALAGLRG